jgi:hypothetical protein
MPNYRRAFVPGGGWFFTVNLLERRKTLLVDHITTLRKAVATTRQGHPFAIDAFVVLPDHLHAVWQLPPPLGKVRSHCNCKQLFFNTVGIRCPILVVLDTTSIEVHTRSFESGIEINYDSTWILGWLKTDHKVLDAFPF